MATGGSLATFIAWRVMAIALAACFVFVPTLVKPHWSTFLELIGGARNANVFGLTGLHAVVLLVGNLSFWALYRLQLPFFERYRINAKPWPFSSPEKAQEFRALVIAAIQRTAFNVGLTVLLAYGNYEFNPMSRRSVDESAWPTPLEVAWQLAAFAVIEDTLFYWGHRMMHLPSLYPHVHKLHHSFNYSVSIAAEYAHPVEYIVANVIPFVTGPSLLGAHLVTTYVWMIYRIGETMNNHSGYEFPWSPWSLLPFTGTAIKHDLHHSIGATGKNAGNFASLFCWWDLIAGTDLPEDLDEAKRRLARAEAVAKQIQHEAAAVAAASGDEKRD